MIFALLQPVQNLYAQDRPVTFERISIEQGLSQNSARCILQDRKGFMWFGTEDGLNKYDGYRFTVYKNNHNDSNSLSNDAVNSIYEDRSGVLWVGTERGGLNKLDREKEKFTHYKNDPNNPNSLSDNAVNSIYEDPDEVGRVLFQVTTCYLEYELPPLEVLAGLELLAGVSISLIEKKRNLRTIKTTPITPIA